MATAGIDSICFCILGHEGIGVVDQVGTGVSEFHAGDKVIISCVTACLKSDFCKRGMYSHCRHGGWILGYTIDGTQAEYARTSKPMGACTTFPRVETKKPWECLAISSRQASSAAL
jgi:threonine dehydrogenase-like Zn-dependent dehydrogenase